MLIRTLRAVECKRSVKTLAGCNIDGQIPELLASRTPLPSLHHRSRKNLAGFIPNHCAEPPASITGEIRITVDFVGFCMMFTPSIYSIDAISYPLNSFVNINILILKDFHIPSVPYTIY
ncbi:hypothetical protein A2U01_0037827 [Trifolium medium]|uniref:Uncharacterized protein n=1 Tax=Trifolium medium TaxID=97028 RepID=A0A392PX44_9FABA|nr:hypothetical protein [Trifolium medium]